MPLFIMNRLKYTFTQAAPTSHKPQSAAAHNDLICFAYPFVEKVDPYSQITERVTINPVSVYA